MLEAACGKPQSRKDDYIVGLVMCSAWKTPAQCLPQCNRHCTGFQWKKTFRSTIYHLER